MKNSTRLFFIFLIWPELSVPPHTLCRLILAGIYYWNLRMEVRTSATPCPSPPLPSPPPCQK